MSEVKDKRIRAKWEKILYESQMGTLEYHHDSSPDEDTTSHEDVRHFVVRKKGNHSEKVGTATHADSSQIQEPSWATKEKQEKRWNPAESFTSSQASA
jgi:outer membrane receptor for monomeric catechols